MRDIVAVPGDNSRSGHATQGDHTSLPSTPTGAPLIYLATPIPIERGHDSDPSGTPIDSASNTLSMTSSIDPFGDEQSPVLRPLYSPAISAAESETYNSLTGINGVQQSPVALVDRKDLDMVR